MDNKKGIMGRNGRKMLKKPKEHQFLLREMIQSNVLLLMSCNAIATFGEKNSLLK